MWGSGPDHEAVRARTGTRCAGAAQRPRCGWSRKPPSSNAGAKVVGRSTTRLRTAGVAVPSLVAVAPVPPRAAALRAGGAVAGEQLDARRRRRRGTACVIWSLSRLRSGRNGSRRQRAYRECRRGKCPDNFSHRNLIPRSVWNYGTYYHSPVWSARGIRNCQKIRGQLTRRSAHRNRGSPRRRQPGVHGAPGPPLSNRRQHHSGDPVRDKPPIPCR